MGGAWQRSWLPIGRRLMYGKWHFTEIDIDRGPGTALKQSTTLVPGLSPFPPPHPTPLTHHYLLPLPPLAYTTNQIHLILW